MTVINLADRYPHLGGYVREELARQAQAGSSPTSQGAPVHPRTEEPRLGISAREHSQVRDERTPMWMWIGAGFAALGVLAAASALVVSGVWFFTRKSKRGRRRR